MATFLKVCDLHLQTFTTPTLDLRLRCGTQRSAWVFPTRFVARTFVPCGEIVVHLLRCPSAKRHVSARFVIPAAIQTKLFSEALSV